MPRLGKKDPNDASRQGNNSLVWSYFLKSSKRKLKPSDGSALVSGQRPGRESLNLSLSLSPHPKKDHSNGASDAEEAYSELGHVESKFVCQESKGKGPAGTQWCHMEVGMQLPIAWRHHLQGK